MLAMVYGYVRHTLDLCRVYRGKVQRKSLVVVLMDVTKKDQRENVN